jgi:TM2 domain-containing membrane protein YozV
MPHVLPGQRHRTHQRESYLAAITLVGGLAAIGCGVMHDGHFVAVCLGIVFTMFGLYSQLVSATTRERWVNVIGIGLAFLGLGLGLSHGGFTL